MKRKVICCALAAALMLILTGCESRDYKEAVALFESGQYSQARTIFADLADYEDSVQWAEKCCYQLALEAMEKKEYLQAKEYLEQAGENPDALRMRNDYAETVIMAVLKEQGELIYEAADPSYTVTLYPETDEKIGIRYDFTAMVQEIEQTQELTITVTLGEKEAQMKGASTGNVLIDGKKTYDIWESVEGVLMLDTYQPGEKIIWNKHVSWCPQGNYPKSVPVFVVCALSRDGGLIVERMITGTQRILQEQNLGITLADLGFAEAVCE